MLRAALRGSKLNLAARAAPARGFSQAQALRKATVFDMPAMSPTMTEGGIVSWQVKAGDSFAAGDVLLDIETDKAQISVEAQDDGVLAKILADDGAKNVQVGTPIAVLAEADDDVASINFDELLRSAKSAEPTNHDDSPGQAAEQAKDTAVSDSAASTTNASENKATAKSEGKEFTGRGKAVSLPSVLRLLDANGLSPEGLKGTGPNGRVTKGDVLAKLGKIPADAPSAEASRIEARQSLDLSGVKPVSASASAAASASAVETKAEKAPKEKPQPVILEEILALDKLLEVSKELGFSLPRAISKSVHLAVRDSILASKPRPSVLRSRALDALTGPSYAQKVPFSHEVLIVKRKGVSEALAVKVVVPPAKKPAELQAQMFLGRLSYYLGEGAGELLV